MGFGFGCFQGAGFIDRVVGQARLREEAKKAAEEAFQLWCRVHPGFFIKVGL